MDKIIQEQLLKVKNVEIDCNYLADNLSIVIQKTTKILPKSLEVGKVYKLKLKKYILMQGKDSTLSCNWNSGKIPSSEIYISEIVDRVPNMIKINGVSPEDNTNSFFGWIPDDGIESIENVRG